MEASCHGSGAETCARPQGTAATRGLLTSLETVGSGLSAVNSAIAVLVSAVYIEPDAVTAEPRVLRME